MYLSEFDYDLPPELIAQEPLVERAGSRLLLVDKSTERFRDCRFSDFPSLLNAGDTIVINNTRVFPARLLGHRIIRDGSEKRKGAAVEALLVKQLGPEKKGMAGEHSFKITEWEVIAKPGRALRIGTEVEFGHGMLNGKITDIFEDGNRRITFRYSGDFNQIVDEIGNTPLPPYIKRENSADDRLVEPRYQTIYAARRGAIAAPTAGLHFTKSILDQLHKNGIQVAEITHHVGYATFQPLRTDLIEEHKIASETYEISETAAEMINSAHKNDKKVVAIGTTTVRALESASEQNGIVRAESGETELFIYPGYKFLTIDALLTNFHLPKSSLLMLVSAFAGRDLILRAYNHAVRERYRFYSYGDCMLIGDWNMG